MSEPVYILGVETSCDETACAVVADGVEVLSSVVASQIDLHARFGGVVPEIASRAHIEAINTVVERALAAASVPAGKISAVAVTNEPGLIGSLLIGLMAAKTMAWIWDVPLIAVNHIYAHAYAAGLNAEPVRYPAVALICSGGHTALYLCRSATELELLGSTIDDAAGEAFDKVASILELGYPGGPAIEAVARRGRPATVPLPRPMLGRGSLDFSFSGLKTAVLYYVNGVPGGGRGGGRGGNRTGRSDQHAGAGRSGRGGHTGRADAAAQAGHAARSGQNGQHGRGDRADHTSSPPGPARARGIANFTAGQVADVAAGFQAAVVDVLAAKLALAGQAHRPRTILLGGGVAANSALRQAATKVADRLGCQLRLPEMAFCMDNAAMIAGLAKHYFHAGRFAALDLEARATTRR